MNYIPKSTKRTTSTNQVEIIQGWIKQSENFIKLNGHRAVIGKENEKKLYAKAIKRNRDMFDQWYKFLRKFYKV